jgi:hypothetical protein
MSRSIFVHVLQVSESGQPGGEDDDEGRCVLLEGNPEIPLYQ